jgi:hypothetical protein
MIYFNSKKALPDLGGLEISPETRLRFDQYFTTYVSARQDPASLEETMRLKFEDTFWYYFHFK